VLIHRDVFGEGFDESSQSPWILFHAVAV